MPLTKVQSTGITDSAVTADKIGSSAVTTAKINADAVTDAKIADDVVGTEHLTAGEVDTTALGADAVTAAKIADDAISEEHLDVTAITGHSAITSLADTDKFLVSDASDSNNLKYVENQYLGGGGLVHITTVSGTSAVSSVNINDCFSSTYETYKLFGTVLVDTDDTKLEMQYTKSSGSTVGTDGYRYIINLLNLHSDSSRSDASTGNWNDTGGAELVYAIDNDATYSPVQFEMTFYDPLQTFASYQYFDGRFTYYSSGGQFRIGTLGGQYRSNFNATGLKFKTDSNNFSRYYFNVYGIKNSGA